MSTNIRKQENLSIDSALRANKVLRNTYMMLGATIATSSMTAYLSQIIGMPAMPTWAMLVGFYGLLFAIALFRNSGLGIVLTFLLTGFMGFALGPVINSVLAMEGGSDVVVNAFGTTALVFFGLSAYALTTKRDLRFLEGFIFAGFLVLFATWVSSFFLSIPGLHLALSAGFVLFSSAVILWKTNSIVRGGEDNYLMATLDLYISLYNMFVSLLNIFSAGKD